MECKKASVLIDRAALGDLKGKEFDDFQEHFKSCKACLGEYQKAKKTVELIESAGPACMPANLNETVLTEGKKQVAILRFRRRMRQTVFSIAAVLLLSFTGYLFFRTPEVKSAENCECWRFVGHDPGNSRHINIGCIPERIKWRQALQGREGGYKPLAWQDLIIVGKVANIRGDNEHRLTAFDAKSGEKQWERKFTSGDFYKAKHYPDRCILKGLLYITDNDQCFVIDARTGAQKKTFTPPRASTGWGYLTGWDEFLIGVDKKGASVFCLNARTGKTVWNRTINGAIHLPAMSNGRLYFHTNKGEATALKAKSGKEIWRNNLTGSEGKSSLHVRGDKVVILSEGDEITILSASSGGVAWTRKIEGVFNGGLAMNDQALYVMGGTQSIDMATGRTLWAKSDQVHGICSAPTLFNNLVLAAAGPHAGDLNIFDATGKLVSKVKNVAFQACDGAIVLKGKIFTIGSGHLLAFECKSKG